MSVHVTMNSIAIMFLAAASILGSSMHRNQERKIEALQVQVAILEATRPNTQTEQERP